MPGRKISAAKSDRTPAMASQWTDGMLLRMTPLVLQRAAAMRTKRRDRARDDCTGVASEAGGEAPAL